MKDKNVIFMGTPDFSVKVLEALISHTNVSLVVTQPDKEVGRKHEIKYSSIKEVALKNNIKIFQVILLLPCCKYFYFTHVFYSSIFLYCL